MNERTWSVDEPLTIEFDGLTEVRLALVKGRFDIVVTESPVATLEISEVDGQPLDVTFADGVLKVEHFNAANWLTRLINFQSTARAVLSIAVPPGTTVNAATVNGDGMVSGSHKTTLRTVSGSLMSDATHGMLSLDTVSGEIIARNHTGHLAAKSVSGEVTASGWLDSIRASTVSANATFDVFGTPSSLVAKSVSGDITVRLPQTVGVAVTASSASGSVVVGEDRFSNPGQTTHTSAGATARGAHLHDLRKPFGPLCRSCRRWGGGRFRRGRACRSGACPSRACRWRVR